MSLAFYQRWVGAAGLALVLAVPLAQAQDAPPVRVRGTIESVDGDTLKVKSRDGSQLTVKLAADVKTLAIIKASISDIKPGTYIGVTGMPQADGSQRAVEVHIFPEAMRGIGDGHRPWDLVPNSTMTNGNIEQSVTSVDGQTLKVKYKDGEKTITVSKDTPFVTYEPGAKSDLKPGIKIFIAAAKKLPDGTLETGRIGFGKDGMTPPM
jgi:hypothetical protein